MTLPQLICHNGRAYSGTVGSYLIPIPPRVLCMANLCTLVVLHIKRNYGLETKKRHNDICLTIVVDEISG